VSKNPGITVLIAGGRTGGHFFSGLAVGEAFLSRNPNNKIVYVGTEHGIEARVAPKQGLDLRFVSIRGLRGKGLMGTLKGFCLIPLALLQSMLLILKVKPKIVIGVGGYASGPVLLMARLMGKATGIVEQNSVAGTTNRILGRFVHRVFIAFDKAAEFFPREKVHFTGNPIREAVVQLLTLEATGTVGLGDRMKILVLGGSQGAHALNRAMIAMPEHLSDDLRRRLFIVHQTGRTDVETVRESYSASGVQAEVLSFIDAMGEAYRSADLVICRAGALTISELTISRRGSVLIPFPHAVDNHQEFNAQALVDVGAGELLLQDDASGEALAATIERLATNRRALQEMALRAGTLAKPQAATEVCDAMHGVAGLPS